MAHLDRCQRQEKNPRLAGQMRALGRYGYAPSTGRLFGWPTLRMEREVERPGDQREKAATRGRVGVWLALGVATLPSDGELPRSVRRKRESLPFFGDLPNDGRRDR